MCIGLHTLPPCLLFCGNYILHESEYDVHIFCVALDIIIYRGTAVEVFRLAVQYSDSPAFTILKLFRAVTVGIVNALEAFMIALLSISISYAPSSLSKTALPLALHHHPCLPCQREVDWRQGTSLDIIAFCLRYANHFYVANFLPSRRRDCLISTASPYNTPSKTAPSLALHHHPCL